MSPPYGGWVSYSGGAKIELTVGLLALAGCAAYAGIRLRRPVRAVRPRAPVVVLMLSLWVIVLVAFVVGLLVNLRQFVLDYPDLTSVSPDPITPVTLLAAVALFIIILTRGGWRVRSRLGGAAVGAMAAPMIFELPFDLIVMARTYPALSPNPVFYRAVFFTPLFLVELTTLWLLTVSPMVRVRKSTFFCFALMIGVFGIWALSGFGYPQSALPFTMNVVSKILAFITALTLFLPDRLRNWRTDGPARAPGRERARQPAFAPRSEQVPRSVGTVATAEHPATGAIKVLGLRKSFGEKEAVAGIDLEIAAGSLAGLVGPNGAGKTTSLSMMTGLLRPDAGQVLINGLDVWEDPVAVKAVIGVVPAEARLFERLSGQEMLEYAGRLRGLRAAQARSRAAQLLDVLDLAADARRLVADYSTGMRKKAMLGCALIHNPTVLFLDEPLEGVDPVSADVIRRLLTRITAAGSTVLFSSHVMELVEQVCDHVSIIDNGKIVKTGTTAQVRGGKTLQQAFIDLVGPRASDEEGLSWLGSSSS